MTTHETAAETPDAARLETTGQAAPVETPAMQTTDPEVRPPAGDRAEAEPRPAGDEQDGPGIEPAEEGDAAAKLDEARRRIEAADDLPRGLRERLLEQIEEAEAAGGDPTLSVADVIDLLEETVPPSLRFSPEELSAAEHPLGDAFFTGDAAQMSDAEAQRIAAEQLAHTGFARSR